MATPGPEKRAQDEIARRLRQLEERLAQTEERLRRIEARQAPPPPVPTFERLSPVAPTPPLPVPPPEMRPVPAPRDIERTLGANWLAKAGMVVLVLGVVFFLKYAFDQGWITRVARIVLGILGGLALAGLGDFLRWYDRQRFNVYAQILTGGGAAISYLSIFVAHALPSYRIVTHMSLELAAILLGALALALGLYAVVRRTPILAAEAIALGTLASVTSGAWQSFSVVYVLLLAAAVVGAAMWRRWPLVLFVALLAAYGNLGILLLLDVDPWPILGAALGLLTLFAAAAHRLPDEGGELRLLPTIVAGLSFLATWGLVLASLDLKGVRYEPWQGPATGLLAVLALGLAIPSLAHRQARQGWAVAGVILALAWPPIQFDGVPTVAAWSLLLAAAAAVHWFRPSDYSRAALIAPGLLLTLHLLGQEGPRLGDDLLPIGDALLAYAFGVLALIGTWVALSVRKQQEDRVARLLLALGLINPLAFALFAFDARSYVVSIAWAIEAVLLLVAGLALSIRDLRMAALGVFGVVVFKVLVFDLVALSLAVRIITFLAVGGLLLAASFLFARRQRSAARPTPPIPSPGDSPGQGPQR